MKYLLLISLFIVSCKQDPAEDRIYIVSLPPGLVFCKKLENFGTCGIELSDCQDQLGNTLGKVLCAHNVTTVDNPQP